jgi:7,8-dihydroneopterin aldolase/epimerase/oxygenase
MSPADRIRLTGVRIDAAHGVYPEEKLRPQPFLIDVEVSLRPRPASDELATTVDYSVLASAIAEAGVAGSVDLIETLAERVAETCLSDSRIEAVEVTVHKPQAPLPVPVSDVSVTITRRSQYER